MPSKTPLGENPRILVIRRDNIGDLVCTTPALTLLRKHYPNSQISVLVNSYNEPVLRGNPDINEVFTYVKGKHVVAGSSRLAAWLGKLKLIQSIRAKEFDVAIVGSVLPTPAWLHLARTVGARHILAAIPPDTPAPRIVTLPVIRDEQFASRHMVEQIAGLLEPLGINEAPPSMSIYPNSSADRMRTILQAVGSTRTTLRVGIHISARKSRQRWPRAHFVALMQELHAAIGCGFGLFWSPGIANDPQHPGDDDKAAAILGASGDLPVRPIPTHTLDELIAGLAAVDAVICSDGGAMHLAAALGKPIISFFGNSDPQTWRPWGVPHRVLHPASQDVSDVTVDETRDAALELFTSCGLTS